jgi:hypothetical protein
MIQQQEQNMAISLQTLECQFLEEYDFDKYISHVIRKNPNLMESVHTALEEYKNFLIACIDSNSVPVPNEDVDAIWHSHILFTKDYFEFCHSFCGHYIHHTPETSNCSSGNNCGTNCSGTGCWGSCSGN